MADQSPTPAGAQPQEGNHAHVEASGHTPGTDTTLTEPFNASEAIDQMTDVNDLHEVLFGQRDLDAPEDPQPAPSAQSEQEPAQGTTEIADPAPTDSEQRGTEQDDANSPTSREPNEQGPDRISLRTLPPAERKLVSEAVNLFRNGQVATLADAFKQLGITAESTPQDQTTTTEDQPTQQTDPPTTHQADAPQADPEVARIFSVLADLRQQRRQAITEYDRQTEATLTDQIEDAVAELSEARATARLQQQQTARQDQLAQSAIEEVHLQFPESEDPNSFFSFRLSRAIEDYEATTGRLVRDAPDRLVDLARSVQQSIGAAPTAQPAQTFQAPKPETQARPLGSAAPGQNSPPRLTGAALLRSMEDASPEELFEALTGVR
jgi:hypothetical protein